MGKQRNETLPPDPFASNKAIGSGGTGGSGSPAYQMPKVNDSSPSKFDTSQYEGYMNNVESGSLFNDKIRAEGQSGWEQAGNSLARAVGEVVGGTISGVGSIPAFFTDIISEGSRQEADFNNGIMQLGEDIISGINERTPIYRENPGKAFDFGDSGWYWENLPSVASSLSLLIPARGVAGGLGMIGKMTGISQKMGKTARFLGNVGTMAVVSRNGENMRESLGVAQQANEKIKETLGNMDASEFATYLGENEIGQKFLATGKEINLENYAKFAGAQAGMEAYKVNAKNIAFDFIQTAIAYKALSGLTRNKNFTNLWMGETSAKVARAEAEALGKSFGFLDNVKTTVKAGIQGSIMGASEGVEEIVNAIGTKEGERVASKAVGKDISPEGFGDRLTGYLGDAHIWDQGFWGFAGGKLFESGSHLLEKVINPGKLGETGFLDFGGAQRDSRLSEINSRGEHIGKVAKDIQDLETARRNGKVTDEQYQDVLQKIGNQSAFDMGINAASNGQVDNLLHSIADPKFKEVLMKNMSEQEKASFSDDKYESIIANLTDNILEAEQIYKNVNTKLSTQDNSVPVHNYILNRGISTSYDIVQREKENAALENEFETELGDSRFSADSQNPDFRSAIENEALGVLQQTYQQQLRKVEEGSGKAEFLNRRLNEIKDRKKVLKELQVNPVELNQDHEKLIALKYKQLGNEYQISTNKESNDKLFNSKNREEVVQELDKVVEKLKSEIKDRYQEALKQANLSEDLSGIDKEAIDRFGDPELTAQYNRLAKQLAEKESKEAELQVKSNETENQSVDQIEENDNTNNTVPVIDAQPGRVSGAEKPGQGIQKDGGLEKVTPQQKERFLKLVDENYASKNIANLERYKAAALAKGFTEEDGFIQDINNKIAELSKVEEVLPVNKEEKIPVIEEIPVIEDTEVDIEEEAIDEQVTVEDVAVQNEQSIPLQAEQVIPETIFVTEQPTGNEADTNLENVTVFIPGIHTLSSETAKRKGSEFQVTKEVGEEIKALKSLDTNINYELRIDRNDPYHVENKEEASIAIYVDSKPVMYIRKETTERKQLERAIELGKEQDNSQNILKFQASLASIANIRNKVWNNPDKIFTTKVKKITSGTIIPGPESNNPLDVIAGTWRLGYVDPQNPNRNQLKVAGENEIYYGTNRETQYNSDGKYTKSAEYVLLEGFNFDGSIQSRIPIKLNRVNLSENSAEIVFGFIEQIVAKMNSGLNLNSEEIESIKDQILEITPVNKFNQEKSELNGQIYYTIPKPYFKVHSNRIEFLFSENSKLGTIWFKDKRDGVTKFVVEEWNSKEKEFANDKEYLAAKGKVIASYPISSTNYKKGILTALQKRPYNVVYPKDGLSIDQATGILLTGRLRADFGTLADKTGNLSNFWGKPEKSLVDGIERYQKGNLVIEIDANIKELGTNNEVIETGDQKANRLFNKMYKLTDEQDALINKMKNLSRGKGLRQQAEEGLLEEVGQPAILENLTKALKQSETERKIIDNQLLVTKTEEAYIIEGELYKRVSNVIGGTFTGDSTLYANSAVAGNTVDAYVRDFFAGKEMIFDASKLSQEAFDALKTRLEGIQVTLIKRGERFLTSNIVVFDRETKVAGEIDILAVNDKDEYAIYDTKTSKNSTIGDKYVKVWSGNGISRSKKDQQEFQTSAYKYLFEKQYGEKITNLGILPFLISYNEEGVIKTLKPEPGIKLKYRKEVEDLIESSLPVKEKKKNTLYDDTAGITFEDGLTMLFTNEEIKENTTPEEKQKNWERMFGKNVPFDGNIDTLIRVKGELAWGIFEEAGAKLYSGAPMGTEYHEAFHATTQLYLTEEELQDLYFDAGEHYGANLTYRDLEERLAEDFRLYALKKDLIKDSKIKTWFSKIWNAIKNYLGIVNRATVFYNIYSGNFNYKPTALVKEFIKKNPLMMEVNDINLQFTQSDIKQYIEWATSIVAADLPVVSGKSNREISENPNQYNLRLRVKARLAQYSGLLAKQGDIETQNAVDAIAENWGDINSGFWNLIVQNVRRKLNYNIGFDENEVNQFQGNSQLQKDWDDKVPYGKSGKESFDFDLKRIIMLTPKLDNTDADISAEGIITFKNINRANSAKLQQPIDFNLVYPMLVSNMRDANSVEEMMERLRALTEVNPSMYYLWNKISSSDELQQKWFTNFRKNYVEESHIRFTDLENEGFEIVHDTANRTYTIADKWVNQLQTYNSLRGSKNEFNGYDSSDISEIKNTLSAYLQAKDLTKSIEKVVELGKVIGVDLDVETLTKLSNNPQLQEHFDVDALGLLNKQIVNNLDWIVTKLIDAMNSNQPFFFNEKGRIKNIADLVSYYMPDVVENSYLNTQGKVVYSMQKPSYLSEFFSKIQAVNNPFTVLKTKAKEELLSEIKERLQDKSFQFSNWIFNTNVNNGLLNLKINEKTIDQITIDDLNLKSMESFSFYKAGDVKQTLSGYGASYTDLSSNDWLLSNLVNYGFVAGKKKNWAMYPIIIPSDSGNIFAIKSKRYKLITDNGNVKVGTVMFRALENVVQQEMTRMEVASNLLFERVGVGANKFGIKPKKLDQKVKEALVIGFHYKKVATKDIIVNGELWYQKGDPITIENGKPTGNVFTFQNMDYYKDGKHFSLNKLSQLKIGEVFSRDLLNSNTNLLLQEHILGFAQNLINEEVARHMQFKETIVQSKIKKKDFLEFWSNNYEAFIGEYALNSYLFNIEQANFFNGVIQEYKNEKDTAKRAKQVSTTKQTTSTIFRGPTYDALIVKDILLDAKDLSKLESNLAKYVKNAVSRAKALGKFKNINVADAQGYITLDRLEAVLKDYGRWNKQYERVFAIARNPNLELSDSDLGLLLQVVKPFSYGRNYNPLTGTFNSVQIKTALLPLIPKLVKGTDLERLTSYLEKNNIGEVYFESAVKVGRQMLSDIHENGKLKPDFEASAVVHTYQNKDWGLQLDVPSHLKDEQNKLGVQIAKLPFANLSKNKIYEVGNERYNGDELRELVQNLMSQNIAQSSQELIEELKLIKGDNGQLYFSDLQVVSDLLTKEIASRGLSKNYSKAVAIKRGRFVVPLSGTNLRKKFMSILSSMFTSRVTNQKFPGGHVVVASPAMLNYTTETGSTVIQSEGIEFIDSVKDRVKDGTFELKYLDIQDGVITKVEALLPSWSSEFFKKGQRININELSPELRTMIGYRIPTEGKYSMFTMEVVGFLPESSGSTIVLPYELIAQTGWDFDVDSVYLMQRSFRTLVNGKEAANFIADKTKIELKQVSKYINEIKKPTQLLEVPKEVRDLYNEFLETATEYRVIESGNKNTDQRNNKIFDVYESILSNPHSFAELVSGGNFNDLVDVKNEVEKLLGIENSNDNIYTRKGQDTFRNTFMSGRALKGMAANANSALAILQNVGSKFRDDLGFYFKYGNEIVKSNILANNSEGTYTNVNGDPITDHNAQSLAMSLDIVKEGFPYNLNTYTFNVATAMVATGVPWMEVGLYIRQPAINRISEKVMNNTSVLDDIEEREIMIVEKEYKAALYQAMVKEGLITKEQQMEDKMVDRKTGAPLPYSKMKVFFTKKATDRLNLDTDLTKGYSKEKLAEMIKMDDVQYRKNASTKERINYYQEQLNIIKQWRVYYDMGSEFSHVVTNLSADKLGAGPDLNVTPDFFKSISRQGVSSLYYGEQGPVIVTNDERFVLDAIYEGDSYPVFKAYVEHGNVAAFDSLSPLFLETIPGYRALKDRIKANLKLRSNETVEARLDKFLFKALYQLYGSQTLTDTKVKTLLGLEKELQVTDGASFEEYQTYSAAEKLLYVQRNFRTKEGVLQDGFKNSFDILNRLTPKLEEGIVEKRQIHSIAFDKPNSSDNVDDFVIESFDELLNSPNIFMRELASDLIKYDFFINGLTYSANSWREFIPMEKQIELGIGTDMKKMMDLVSQDIVMDFEDMFMRNNWNNVNVVPIAKTKYQYDDQGNRISGYDEATYEEVDVTDSKFFEWDSKVNTLTPFRVSKDKLKLEKQSIKNARYLLIKTKTGSTLVKRMLFNDERDTMKDPSDVWYYPVNKLGSLYIGNEISTNSVLEFNNIGVTEDAMIQQINGNKDFQVEQGNFLAKKNSEKQC